MFPQWTVEGLDEADQEREQQSEVRRGLNEKREWKPIKDWLPEENIVPVSDLPKNIPPEILLDVSTVSHIFFFK
jgi:hypothetical protein